MKRNYKYTFAIGMALFGILILTGYIAKNKEHPIRAFRDEKINNPTADFPSAMQAPNSIREALEIARTIHQENPVNEAALEEMASSIHDTKANYEKVTSAFQDAIATYEKLSENFDAQLRQGARTQDLVPIEQQLEIQAKKVMALKKQSNEAYVDLMNRIDQEIPAILEKHF